MLCLIKRTVITDEGFRRNVHQKCFSLSIYTYIYIYVLRNNEVVLRNNFERLVDLKMTQMDE